MTLKTYFKEDYQKKGRVCVQCNAWFVPIHHGGTKQFCSYRCSNIYKWKARIRKIKIIEFRKCEECGKQFQRNQKYSIAQWRDRKYCSVKCAGLNKQINDGMSKSERYHRRNGSFKQFTPEWLDRLRNRTKEGMAKPEVQEKLHNPRNPMSEEMKAIKSDQLVGKMPKNMMFGGNGSFPNVQRGDYECSKGTVYFRSKWEANYALYLDFLIKNNDLLNWEYEAEIFIFEKIKFGTRSYRPDFKIYNSNGSIEFHEIKGYMDSRSKTKLKRMDIYFPEVKLVLIERKTYMDILKKMKGVIIFY